ncbi:MAG: Gfo/Idh/MocA family protein [Puniceicoccaceae bacterium]
MKPPLPNLSRRSFIKGASLTACGVAASGCSGLFGKSEVRFAVVGLRIRGMQLIRQFLEQGKDESEPWDIPPVRLVAICDVDSEVLAESAMEIEAITSEKVETYNDYQVLLEQKHIDAVVIATPNHWHALQTIWACEAGKDVYVEKPVCHSVWEGRQMVAAARRYKRIVQSGTQNRSDLGLLAAFPRILAGELGPIRHIHGLCYRNRHRIGIQNTPLVPPASVNYDQWLGPADDLPMYRPQFHYDWHWVWNTGNGDIGNQGPHEMDLIRWVLGDPDHPQEVFSFGGRFAWDDAGETPNMQVTSFRLNGVPVTFEVRNLTIDPQTDAAPSYLGWRVGVIVTCEGGQFRGGRGGGFFYDNEGQRMQAFPGDGGGDHMAGFFRAVASRRRSELNSPLREGYLSSCLSHLGNISYRLGNTVSDETLRSSIADDPWLVAAHERHLEQLKAWNLNPAQLEWTRGPLLKFDGASEQFHGDLAAPANALLRRDGRAPYTIPSYA